MTSTSFYVGFDTIYTDLHNRVTSIELSETHALIHVLKSDQKIQSMFDSWEDLSNQMVLARCCERTYLLAYSDSRSAEGETRQYLLFDGSPWQKLEKGIEKLTQTNRELDAIIESSFDGIYITDRTGVTLKTNAAIERITGIPKYYYIGKNIHQLIERGILTESVTLHVMEKKRPVSLVQKNNNGKETLMTGSPIFNEQGEVEKIVTNIRDLSELNHLNVELNKPYALKEKLKGSEGNRLKGTGTNPLLKSKEMEAIYALVERLASFDPTMVILGETGVGKDVLVKHIYQSGLRSNQGQLIKINCGAIPKELIESELFGYDRGSFSGASRSGKPGLFELANKGILFLDEIGEMPLDLQVKLLHAIQEKEIFRVGGTMPKKVDVQIIAATNKDLKKMVEEGTFREDLYYRLNVVPIHIPPLRKRRADILPLVVYFLSFFNKKYHARKWLDDDVQHLFYSNPWPGNVRELSNVIERLVLTLPRDRVTREDLPAEYQKPTEIPIKGESLKAAIENVERNLLTQALNHYKTTYELADHLSTSQATIVRKLKKYNLNSNDSKMNH
ncbi:MAG TPA: sigma 54-interacting transcriptional regulator [Candidatus Angelobacter sp.]|nr:sigma 54-interacting transcriptional regulator [Candidatus Angelobacter sp.]